MMHQSMKADGAGAAQVRAGPVPRRPHRALHGLSARQVFRQQRRAVRGAVHGMVSCVGKEPSFTSMLPSSFIIMRRFDFLSSLPPLRSPAGKYSDRTGGRTVIDCSNCTAGKWTLARASLEVSGETACTGVCPLGKFGAVSGAKNNEEANCRRCPPGYRSEQCDRKENAHQIKRANDRERKLRLLRARQQSRQTSCSQGNEAATMRV